MKSFVLIGVICLQCGGSYAKGYSNGVGAFSYQDSSGNRYGGTYGLKDGEVVDTKGSFPPDFSPQDFQPHFEDPDDFLGFFPEYFRNFENLLQDTGFPYHVQVPQMLPNIQTTPYTYSGGPAYNEPEYGNYNSLPKYSFYGPNINHIPNNDFYNHNINRAFQTNIDSQKLALDAAHKAFDLTSNQAGISHNLNPSRFSPFNARNGAPGFPNMAGPQFPSGFPFSGGFQMPEFQNNANSAYASAAVGPGYTQQVAAVNPSNPNNPNVFRSDHGSGNPGGYHSVSVSSYSSSSDVGGRKTSKQSADTMINSNGKVSKYHVESP